MKLRTSHAHEEGCERDWSVATTSLSGKGGRVRALHAVRVEARAVAGGRMEMAPVAGSAFKIDTDLVLLAMGFVGPSEPKLLTSFGVALDARGAVGTDSTHHTNVEGVFAAGDVRRGASLIVWAIREGRDAAAAVHAYLEGRPLPRPLS
jgi:glutamate synthase (NADPH/NADH) small chain